MSAFTTTLLRVLLGATLLLGVPTVLFAQITINGGGSYADLQSAVTAAAPGDLIGIPAGTFVVPAAVSITKANLTIQGAGSASTTLQVSGSGDRLLVNATGVTIRDLEILKTDKTGVQNIVYVGASNFSLLNCVVHGQFVIGDGDVSRAMVIAGGLSGLLVDNNTFYALRQPAYMSGTTTGTFSNNYTYGTKGWVLEGGSITMTGNTWGTGAQTNVYDVAILSLVPAGSYTDIVAMSNANNGAVIEDQRVSPAVLSVVYVDASTAYVSDLGGRYHPYATITPALTRVVAGGTIRVAAGTYAEDLSITKSLSLLGAGSGSTTISGPIGGGTATVQIAASNVTVAGFTITRAGNNLTDWNNAGLNLGGITIQGTSWTGNTIRDNVITGNRTAIDINSSSGHTIRNNAITNNRTGLIFRNVTDNLTVIENAITGNWTVGVLFLDASGGTNSPLQTALNCTFRNNDLTGNWYAQVADRQTGGSLPLPGANMKNFSGNWFGSTAPVVTTAATTEPGYSAQIPVVFGGTAVAPGGQPDIAGSASANVDFTPLLPTGTDTDVETVLGRGTSGFQGDNSTLAVTAASPQSGTAGRIQEGVNATATPTIQVLSGTYNEQVLVTRAVSLQGTGVPQPTVNFTGTVTGRPALFDVTGDAVTINNIHFSVDLSKLRSAIIASAAGIDNITVTNNLIDAYGTPAGSYGDRNAVSVNYGGPTNYRLATGGVNSVTFTGNTVGGSLPTSFFRSGLALDEGGGTFTGNTLQTISHDILVRFGGNGPVTLSNNNFNGGGVELADQNAAAGTITVSNNIFTGGASDPSVALLRIKNNYNAIPHVVSANTFNYNEWAVSLENMNSVTLDGNTFTSAVAGAHAVVVNTKSITSNSSGIVQVAIGATMTNNAFNGTGTALTFQNHDDVGHAYGTFTLGTAGNENTFAATLSSFVTLDGQSGSSDLSPYPNYAGIIGVGGTKTTTMAPWGFDLTIQKNMFDVGTGPKLPKYMSPTERTTLEGLLTHKPDNAALGTLTYVEALTAGGGIWIGGQVNPVANDIFAGFDAGAEDAVDAMDAVAPPPPPSNYLHLYFRTAPGQPIENYAIDIKKDEASTATVAKAWDLKAITDHTSSLVTLTFPDAGLPAGFKPTLYDLTANTHQDVRANPTFIYTSPATETAASFRLLMGDSTKPSVSVTAPNGGEFLIVGTPSNITWTSSDGSGVLEHEIYYSLTGAAPYTLLTTVDGSVHSYAWTPAAASLNASVKVVARDSVLNEEFDVCDHTFTILASNAVSLNAAAGWNLVSPAMLQGSMTPGAIFGDDYGATPYYTFKFSATSGYSAPATLAMGQGYWLGSNSAQLIDAVGTPLTSASLALTNGFNIIGNPFAAALLKADLRFFNGVLTKDMTQAAAAGWLSNVLYGYNAGYFTEATSLGVWQGYWVPMLQPGITIQYAPSVAVPTPKMPVAMTPTHWDVAIEATLTAGDASYSDRVATFGVREDATAGFNPVYDAPRPPRNPVNGYVEIAFPAKDEASGELFGSSFARVFKSADKAAWEFTVASSIDGAITLSWDNSEIAALPADVRIDLIDKASGTTIDMKRVSSYRYTQAGLSHRFAINRSVDDRSNVPSEFSLSQNYPNPFNPTSVIRYGLPSDAVVFLEVYNSLGQKVATILDGASEAAGFHQVTFDATSLSSGLYLYRLKATSSDGSTFTQSRKMLFTK